MRRIPVASALIQFVGGIRTVAFRQKLKESPARANPGGVSGRLSRRCACWGATRSG